MEKMTIRLISLVENDGHIRARLRADAHEIGVRMHIEVRFTASADSKRVVWMEEAYDRALAVLDPS